MKKSIFILLLLTTFISCKNDSKTSETLKEYSTSEENLTTAQTIAYKNGFENWDKVSEIKFTFNVDRGEVHSERSWLWKPKTNDVVMITATDSIKFNRNSDNFPTRADAAFVNDKYWLLAPFNLIWDEGTSFEEEKNVIAPISKDTLNKLTILYGDTGGYTPGDAYDFFYTNDFIVKEWVFRKGNDSIPSMTNTWEEYKLIKGLNIATMHKDSTGGFKLYFTDIEVK